MKPLSIVFLALLTVSSAHARELPGGGASGSSITLESLLTPGLRSNNGISALRAKMLSEAGRTVGFRGGLAARAGVLIDELALRRKALDAMFQFHTLIGRNGAVPPVIVEARDLSAFSDDQIRTASRVYKIQREEHFVSVPPTWRDYLFVGLLLNGGVDLPAPEARPKGDDELAIWREAVKAGWSDGEAQAIAILQANFDRLVRDYTGMIRYSVLLQQGMITRTQVAESRQTVTGNTKELKLGDSLRRLTKKAEFETDANKWRPTVTRGIAPQPLSAPAFHSPATPEKTNRKTDSGK
jgi:defect in organelle trafficking protein DotC